jgi:hypothetical protein
LDQFESNRLRPDAVPATEPACEPCLKEQRIETAVAVDHIVAVKASGDEAYLVLDGLRSLGASCLNRKTRAEQLGEEPTIKGCDIHGYPLDPRHRWYRE